MSYLLIINSKFLTVFGRIKLVLAAFKNSLLIKSAVRPFTLRRGNGETNRAPVADPKLARKS